MSTMEYVIGREYRTASIKRFDVNRQRFLELIYAMKNFSKEEILHEFSSSNCDTQIDTHQTLEDYLEEMVSLGLLRLEYGRYSIQ